MPTSSAGSRVNSAWGSDELLQLVQAWEEVVDDPKNRLLLSTGERSTLHARFCAIAGSDKRSLSSVTRQHHRLCMSYRLIVETNKRSAKKKTPAWFDLSTAEQQELRRAYTNTEKGVTVIDFDLFQRLDRMCGGQPVATTNGTTKSTAPSKTKSKINLVKQKHCRKDSSNLEEDMLDTLKSTWTARDWALFVDAWQEAVDDFLDIGNEPDEKVRLPNWLIRQKFIALGGPRDTSVGSITAKKRCIIQSYHFICQCVAGLDALDQSDWFELTFNERFRLQRKLVSPKSSQRVGCEIDRDTFQKVGVIIKKEEELGTVLAPGHKRKRSHKKKVRKQSMSSETSSESSLPQSLTSFSSRGADEVSEPDSQMQSLDPSAEVEGMLVDEQVVEALLKAQNARFEQLMHELREERMEERKQNQAMLLEILYQRTPSEDCNQNVSDMESLVEKQQEQLMDLFSQMHRERQQEREDFHALVRQLCALPRS
ncbi:unnamed protein product [Hyaloperonospora brassicae]|uniref:Myb-like domain-containing protein n=1 Tax=Hyaloperonospora brassicae TaxID=162125 RepID=A0AAV0USH5_HYABA|nr:unnamed protein product [Hyaloperonospora brassicae]